MLERIKEEEINFMESWYTPRCLIECLFSNLKDEVYSEFNKKNSEIRLYQRFFISQESLIDWETTQEKRKLSDQQIFDMKKRVGELYNLGARKYGKSLSLKLNIILSSLFDNSCPTAFYSVDEKRLRGILVSVEEAMTKHPILREFKYDCRYKPEIRFTNELNHWHMKGINMALTSRTPGSQFYSIHSNKLFGDEVSFETEDVFTARKDAGGELGVINIFSGMTNFVSTSPIGRLFNDKLNEQRIINYPQAVNPNWNEREKQERLKEWGGESSLNYRVFVKGEIIKEGVSAINMELVEKQCYKNESITHFELTRDQFPYFDKLIVVSRPKTAERIFIASDVGESGGTEISIFSEHNEIFNYIYNITLFNFIEEEQYEIFKWLVYQLDAEVVALDCGDALGRGICDRLEKLIPLNRIVRYSGNTNIDVSLERLEDGKIKKVNGKAVYRQEKMAIWSVEHLKKLLYGGKIKIPFDYKLDNQMRYVIQEKGKNGFHYSCASSQGDHIWDSFKVFSIAHWLKKEFIQEEELQLPQSNSGSFVTL